MITKHRFLLILVDPRVFFVNFIFKSTLIKVKQIELQMRYLFSYKKTLN